MSKKKKQWSYSAGEKGRNRVRAYENDKGYLFLEWWDPKRRRKAQTDEAAAKLAVRENLKPPEFLLGSLIDKYLQKVTPSKSARTQKHDYSAAKLFLRCFGENKKPKELNRIDWDRFVNDRSNGRLKPPGSKGGRVGPRTVERDLKWLLAVLNWATLSRDDKGGLLLERNPLKGLKPRKEENPCQPLMPEVRYLAMVAVSGRVNWRFRVALILAHETGHRIGAIRQLRWCDVDFEALLFHWDEAFDKMKLDHFTAMSENAEEVLREARFHNPGVGNTPVFPAPREPVEAVSRNLMWDWWRRAEGLAGLKPEKGLGWHGLRRKFATDFRFQPLVDVCDAGGWKRGSRVVMELYQKPDLEAQRAMLKSRKRASVE